MNPIVIHVKMPDVNSSWKGKLLLLRYKVLAFCQYGHTNVKLVDRGSTYPYFPFLDSKHDEFGEVASILLSLYSKLHKRLLEAAEGKCNFSDIKDESLEFLNHTLTRIHLLGNKYIFLDKIEELIEAVSKEDLVAVYGIYTYLVGEYVWYSLNIPEVNNVYEGRQIAGNLAVLKYVLESRERESKL